jgi:predicted RNA-binding protein with PUA domain
MLQKKFIFKNYYSKTKSIAVCLIILLIMVLAFPLAGCSKKVDMTTLLKNKLSGEDAMNAAVVVVDDFFRNLKSGNLEESFNLISSQDKLTHGINDFKKELENVTQIVDIEINWVEVKNNIADVGIDLVDSYDNEEKVYKDIVVSLVKEEDESWKINFWD